MSKSDTYIVTGAGSGIGRAIADRIVTEGRQVFGLGRDIQKLKAVAQELGSAFSYAAGDLTSPEDTTRVVAEIRKWLGEEPDPRLSQGKRQLKGLVNNAGVFDRVSFNEGPDSLWQRQFDSNLLTAVRLTREIASLLGSGSSVLNISSTLALRPVANTSAYSAMKAAMVAWSQALALEWAPLQIRVNCLCPGLVDTPIHGFFGENDSTSESRRQAHAMQPLARLGKASEIASSAWFLLSPESAWTTGAVLSVDGGIGL